MKVARPDLQAKDSAGDAAAALRSLQFKFPFRKYQRLILEGLQDESRDRTYHIVAPAGSGKTIIGIELIRRFGQPAVVFAPTTTIQMQWRDKVRMFLATEEALPELTSTSSSRLAPINIYTYQLISTPGEEQDRESAIALEQWLEDLVEEGRAPDQAAAQERIDRLERNNPAAYRRELANRYQRAKRQLLRGEAAEIQRFLHPNALQLIHHLVAHGVRTIVLDECHHLLDYWAIVLRYMLAQIPGARVIGLTATLPSPEDDREYENYTALLGGVDFEVPTPAVVKEGDLAPYRDLAYFVAPSETELEYLRNIQAAFETITAEITSSPPFRRWINLTISEQTDWAAFVNANPLFSLALMRYKHRQGDAVVAEELTPVEAREPMTVDDWVLLLEKYGLNVLKLSENKDDHLLLARLRRALLPFGFTLTERGLRQSRSAGDLVLAFSESKDQAVTDILRAEQRAMGDRLRAVIITDFERMSSGVRRLGEVLDPDAGSALRLFRHIAAEQDLTRLRPILVTGTSLMIAAASATELLEAFTNYLSEHRLRAEISLEEPGSDHYRAVRGTGPDWGARTYVAMVTNLFDQGQCRCLVGTRGILGEGWDSLKLNTLIDLTSVTTSTAVQQLRGRSIRKDPDWPKKVAHNWDVICVAPEFEKGQSDLRRLVSRHNRYWGIITITRSGEVIRDIAESVTPSRARPGQRIKTGISETLLGTEVRGQIVKGLAHVDPNLAYDLAVNGFQATDFPAVNQRMLDAVYERALTYELWGVGEEYRNEAYMTSRVDARGLKMRTVYTVQNTLSRLVQSFTGTAVLSTLLSAYMLCQLGLSLLPGPPFISLIVGAVLLAITAITFFANLRKAIRIGRQMLVRQPPDAILHDAGRALLRSLREAGAVSRDLGTKDVRVIGQRDGSFQVALDRASPEDASTFIQSFGEIFEPVYDQRYLILRDDHRLPRRAWMPLWRILRRTLTQPGDEEPAYYPVPRLLSSRRQLAELFADNWWRYVGGGELIFTRSDSGRAVLLAARARRRPSVNSLAFEIWR